MLIVPPAPAHYIVPPVGLGYLATALRKAGFNNLSILDGQKINLTPILLKEVLVQQKPAIVGLQVFSSGYSTAQEIVEITKKVLPDSVVVLGGPHVTATAQRVLNDFPMADFAFQGEAEPGFPLLVKCIFNKENILEKISGLIFRQNDQIRLVQRAIVEDLDSLGFPAWDLMPPNTYPDVPQGAFYKRFPIAPILTSRGCPYECAYCGSPVNMTRRYRVRSISHVLDEIEMLVNKYGVKEIHIIDDMFSLKKERVLEFCDGLESRKIDISYTFPNGLRLDSLDKKVLVRMKQTGAYAFTVGIESGSQRILDAMKKRLTLGEIREKVQLIRECELEPSGFFIIGYPGETVEDIKATIKFAKSLPLKRAHFSNFLPLPGTEATEELYRRGEITEGNWDQLSYYQTPYAPKGMTRNELKKWQRYAFLSFHLRPKILWGMIREIKSWRHFEAIIVRAKDYLLCRRNKVCRIYRGW